MQDGGLQVVDVHGIFGDVDAVVVGLAIGHAAAHAAAGHPVGETVRVMVAAVNLLSQFALAVDRAAELAAPDDECVVEHTALLEVEQ